MNFSNYPLWESSDNFYKVHKCIVAKYLLITKFYLKSSILKLNIIEIRAMIWIISYKGHDWCQIVGRKKKKVQHIVRWITQRVVKLWSISFSNHYYIFILISKCPKSKINRFQVTKINAIQICRSYHEIFFQYETPHRRQRHKVWAE